MNADEERLKQAIEAYHVSALAYAAVRLGLPETMGGQAWRAEALARQLKLAPEPCHRFLRALATVGVCEERADGSFILGGLGQSLKRGSSSRLGEKVGIVVGQYWRPWAELSETLKTGDPAFEAVFGTDVWSWRSENFQDGDTFAAYLAAETSASAAPIIEALDLSGIKTVADIGGGHGGLLAAILKSHPDLSGILFDVPETLIGAKKVLKARGVEDRVTLVGGDFLAEIPVEADLYILKNVLQHWDDAAARIILESCREAMPEGARLAIIERLLPEHAADDPAAIMADLHMMVISGGKCRKLGEFGALLSEAGLTLAKTTPTTSGLTIIEAVGA